MTKLADKLRAVALAPRPFPLSKVEIRTIKLAASEIAALHQQIALVREEALLAIDAQNRRASKAEEERNRYANRLSSADLHEQINIRIMEHVNGAMGCTDPVDVMEAPRAVAQIVKALAFYADPASYKVPHPSQWAPIVEQGARAREALGIPEPKPKIRMRASTTP
jgi:hypothetical protein